MNTAGTRRPGLRVPAPTTAATAPVRPTTPGTASPGTVASWSAVRTAVLRPTSARAATVRTAAVRTATPGPAALRGAAPPTGTSRHAAAGRLRRWTRVRHADAAPQTRRGDRAGARRADPVRRRRATGTGIPDVPVPRPAAGHRDGRRRRECRPVAVGDHLRPRLRGLRDLRDDHERLRRAVPADHDDLRGHRPRETWAHVRQEDHGVAGGHPVV